MTKKKIEQKPPIDDLNYHQLFSNGDQRENALRTALDTRKFEIDMYWKRATYFWAFIAAAFAAYFAILSSDNIDNYRIITILISGIGYCFSLGWYFVNRGSKFWQENWEAHVVRLEREIQGPLFALVKIPKDKFQNINGHYFFSVSKINQILSLITTISWMCIFVGSIIYTVGVIGICKNINLWELIAITFGSILTLLGLGYFIYKNTLSFAKNEHSPNSKCEFFFNIDTTNNKEMRSLISMGNDEFILYIRKQNKSCKTSNKELGKKIWMWIESQDPDAKQVAEDLPCLWESSTDTKNIDPSVLPKTATQFEFKRSLLPELYSYLDSL